MGGGGVWGHRRRGGLRQINTCRKVPWQVIFFRWRHLTLVSIWLISPCAYLTNVRLLGLGAGEGGVIERKTTVPSTIRFGKVKGTQDWEFFWLRFWNLHYFFVSYVKILRFYKKKILNGPLLGEVRFFRVVLGLRGMEKNFEVGPKNFFFFLQLWTLNMTQYSFFVSSIN
jgi:hypothetical protein